MKFTALLPPELNGSAEPDWVSEFALHAERLGFDEISVVEHSVVIRDTSSAYPYDPSGRSPLPDDCPLPDPLELLAFIAARTTSLGLATGVLVLPNQHPVVLAKRLATLDRLSGGRLRVCLGLGWMREEIEACGGDFDRRGKHADEAIATMRALWSGTGAQGVSLPGPRYTVHGAHSWPKPHDNRCVPIYIGGHSLAAARRAGRIGDGFQPLGLGGAALLSALDALRDAARSSGRNPDDVALVLGGNLLRTDPAAVERAAARGAQRMVLSPGYGADAPRDLADLLDQMSACAQRLGLAAHA
ncbi:MAG: LLM class F420-dependent oxidoreductase [Jatrophihabitans sp.]